MGEKARTLTLPKMTQKKEEMALVREELSELKGQMGTMVDEFKKEMREMRTEMLLEMKAEVRQITDVRDNIKAELGNELRAMWKADLQAALSEHEAKLTVGGAMGLTPSQLQTKPSQPETLGADSGVGEDRDATTRVERDMDLTGDITTPLRGPAVRSKQSDMFPVPEGMEAAALVADQRGRGTAATPYTPLGEYGLRYPSTSTPLGSSGGGRRSHGASLDRHSYDRNPFRRDSSVRGGGSEHQPADDSFTRGVAAQLPPATTPGGTREPVRETNATPAAPESDGERNRGRSRDGRGSREDPEWNVKLLAPFDGKEDWEGFLGPFERMAKKNGWNKEVSLDKLSRACEDPQSRSLWPCQPPFRKTMIG